ncbi:MAG: hypothetical protein WKF37_07350 [Bryobacteraceae bacterium]
MNLSIGLKLLEGVLRGMGQPVSMPSLEAGFASAQRIQFAFADVVSYAVKPFEIGNWLQEAISILRTPSPVTISPNQAKRRRSSL